MASQQNIQTCLLNASYKLTTLVQRNLALINRGGVPSNTDTLQFWRFNIVGLTYLYDFGIYTSDIAIGLYDRLLGFIGIPSNATVDPNFQAPNTIIIVEGGDTGAFLEITIPATPTYSYALTGGEIAIVNQIGRIPNFVLLVGGVEYSDSLPTYVGTAGAYTAITITLNTDSLVTVVQFS